MVSAAKVLQDLRASAERKPDVVVRLGKPLVESGAVKKLDADGKAPSSRAARNITATPTYLRLAGRTLISKQLALLLVFAIHSS